MEDENIKSPEENETDYAPQVESDREELEELRNTFQTVLDEESAKAENQPTIQELDSDTEETGEENGEDEEENTESDATASNEKKKKTKKKVPVAAIIIPIILCVLIIIPLVSYVVLSVKVPNFGTFISAYSSAMSATDASDKVTNYEAALEYCTEDSLLAGLRQDILESIVVAKCEADGYSSAYSYMTENLTEEMIASPSSSEFKDFLKIGDTLDEISAKLYSTAVEAVGDKTDVSDIDFDALCDTLGVSSLIKTDISNTLKFIGEGVAKENAAETKDDIQDAITSYFNGYSLLSQIGGDTTPLLESITVKLYDNGYAYEAQLVVDSYLGENDNSASTNEEFKTVISELESLKNCGIDLYTIVAKLYAEGKTSEKDLTAALKSDKLSESAVNALTQIALTEVEAFDSEKEHNLTKASDDYNSLLGALGTFDMPAEEAAVKSINVLLNLGDSQSATTVKTNYLAEAELSEEDQKTIDTLDALYNAQYNANEVFYPYYYNYAYYGSTLDKAEINAALDELITDDSDIYAKAFVDYYKYLAEGFTDADNDTMLTLIKSFAEKLSDYPFFYGYAYAQLCQDKGDSETAVQIAEKLLAINTADDFANSILAIEKLGEGDIDGALEISLNGIELSGDKEYCAYEAAVAYLLKGEYKESYDLAYELYTNSITTNYCELIKVINAKYDGDDAEFKAELTETCASIDETYTNYGVELSEDAQGIIDGTLTLEDVFLKGNCNFG